MKCKCGCGLDVKNQFVSGHNLRGRIFTDDHRHNLSASLRRAWLVKRHRLPIGHKRKDAQGYILVKVTMGTGEWKREHRLVAERALGRKLERHEHVHHINCIRDDNRPENLHVFKKQGWHTAAHASLNGLLEELIQAGVVEFDKHKGRYIRRAQEI